MCQNWCLWLSHNTVYRVMLLTSEVSKVSNNSNFLLIQRKTLQTNDFEITVPDLYIFQSPSNIVNDEYFDSVRMGSRPE